MPSNNSKYTEEMRTQTAEFILRSGKSATSVAEEMGIDTNTAPDGYLAYFPFTKVTSSVSAKSPP